MAVVIMVIAKVQICIGHRSILTKQHINSWIFKSSLLLIMLNVRYKYCWLPLLAKHTKFQVTEGPLVVPLDCEWVWHCHRLNPVGFSIRTHNILWNCLHLSLVGLAKLWLFVFQVRYKNDCEELYGRILDNWNVASSIQGTCKKQTEEIWKRMYPAEPYEISLTSKLTQNFDETILGDSKGTKYDLDSAVKRQCSFFYQVMKKITC